ncbi:MAG: thiamine ABC transporter substrate-binding protein [Propionicimonas sp.]|uniref:thiamine ABC transporter substrate-binding protein n=1 Tax=Propionicimonas sp. TaxID=1955623 RepID=UPI003D0DCB06
MSMRHWAAAAAAAVLLAGCAGPSAATSDPATPEAPTESTTLTVITHDSFALSKEALATFKAETGYDVSYVAPGDVGTVVNQLILTKDAPLGDVVFGIDNTFAGRAVSAGILSPYTSADLPEGADAYAADDTHSLTPIDYGDVCLNADTAWFEAKGLAVPQTLDDLLKPEYANLLVVENPASSSPGMAFLAATVGAKGADGYLDYWKALKANGVKVVKGWTEAYTVQFSGSSGKGAYPLVVSYSSSPAYEHGTQALTQTCFRQVEYAGVLAGAQNEVGARKFIDFLLSAEVQAEIPEQMYMDPVDSSVELPADWKKYAAVVDHPIEVSAADLGANREAWIKAWTATVIG